MMDNKTTPLWSWNQDYVKNIIIQSKTANYHVLSKWRIAHNADIWWFQNPEKHPIGVLCSHLALMQNI